MFFLDMTCHVLFSREAFSTCWTFVFFFFQVDRLNNMPCRMLILHLARFCFENGQVSKNESKVGVPENVVVATTRYRLLAVVKHKGSRHTGHYIAEIRSERGWLLCNDARVERIEKQSMEYCSDAYILFYEAVPSQDLPVS